MAKIEDIQQGYRPKFRLP